MTVQDNNGIKKYLGRHAASLLVALLIQSGALVWWASALTTRVNYIERDVQKLCLRVLDLEKTR